MDLVIKNAISSELLALLRCPETRQPLFVAEPALLADLNGRVTAGVLKNRGGALVKERFDGALVRADQRLAYPVRQRIPILLVEEAILLE